MRIELGKHQRCVQTLEAIKKMRPNHIAGGGRQRQVAAEPEKKPRVGGVSYTLA